MPSSSCLIDRRALVAVAFALASGCAGGASAVVEAGSDAVFRPFDGGETRDDEGSTPGVMDAAADRLGADASIARDAAGDAAPPNWPRFPVPSCPMDTHAPVPNPEAPNGIGCVPVGASAASDPGFPDTAGSRGPFVYVRVGGATAGTCGAITQPCGTIERGLEVLTEPGTLVVAPGMYPLAATVRLSRAVTILGAGPRTSLAAPAGAAAFEVTGSAANVTLARVQVTGLGAMDARGVDVRDAATVTLRDVELASLRYGVDATRAFVRADGLTVAGASAYAVAIREGADGNIKGLLARAARGPGVFVSGGRITLTESLVADSAGPGLWLRNATPAGTNRIDRVASHRNGLAGMLVEGAGCTVEATRLSLSGTRAVGGAGGDGLLVRDGASATFDPGIRDDARRGHGSWFVQNARAGVVATARDTLLAIRGGQLLSNPGGGLVAQQNAVVTTLGFSELNNNLGVGAAAVSGGSIVALLCNLFEANIANPLAVGIASLSHGDGAVITGRSVMTPVITGNRFERQTRFDLLFVNANAMVSGNETAPGVRTFARFGMSEISGSNANQLLDADTPAGAPIPSGTESLPVPMPAAP